jgi:hypothetical protein
VLPTLSQRRVILGNSNADGSVVAAGNWPDPAGAGFKVLDNPALDTTSAHGKLLVDLLAAIGEFEPS